MMIVQQMVQNKKSLGIIEKILSNEKSVRAEELVKKINQISAEYDRKIAEVQKKKEYYEKL